ncbi:MAG: transposase [Planctomyces sp.]|nr:transposase [Planctomyces sp.]
MALSLRPAISNNSFVWSATIAEPRKRVPNYVDQYNTVRLHSAIGYVTPADKRNAPETKTFEERDRKLEEPRKRRALSRQGSAEVQPERHSGGQRRMRFDRMSSLLLANRYPAGFHLPLNQNNAPDAARAGMPKLHFFYFSGL